MFRGTQGWDSPGAGSFVWGWRVAAPATPSLGGARSLGAAPWSAIRPRTCRPQPEPACPESHVIFPSATLPGLRSPPEVGEGPSEALLPAQAAGPHSQALQDPGRWVGSSDCFHVLQAPSGSGSCSSPRPPAAAASVSLCFFPQYSCNIGVGAPRMLAQQVGNGMRDLGAVPGALVALHGSRRPPRSVPLLMPCPL